MVWEAFNCAELCDLTRILGCMDVHHAMLYDHLILVVIFLGDANSMFPQQSFILLTL